METASIAKERQLISCTVDQNTTNTQTRGIGR